MLIFLHLWDGSDLLTQVGGKSCAQPVGMNGCSVWCSKEVVMKTTSAKAMVAKVMTVGMLAGVVMLAAPAKAQAQVVVGVQFGGGYPVYAYDRRDYYERLRCEQARQAQIYAEQQAYARQQAWAQHEAWERHEREEAWERQRAFGRYDDHGWRDRDDHHDRDDHDRR
jgi:hypothetical protein